MKFFLRVLSYVLISLGCMTSCSKKNNSTPATTTAPPGKNSPAIVPPVFPDTDTYIGVCFDTSVYDLDPPNPGEVTQFYCYVVYLNDSVVVFLNSTGLPPLAFGGPPPEGYSTYFSDTFAKNSTGVYSPFQIRNDSMYWRLVYWAANVGDADYFASFSGKLQTQIRR